MSRSARSEFEEFYIASRDRCFRALLATVNSSSDADDLLAEAYTRALAKWTTVSSHPAPEAWVVRTALNLHRDRWRRSKRAQRRRHERSPQVAFIDVVDPALIASIRALPERQRDVVVLRVLLGLSAEQTSTELGIEPGTVGTHLRRALGALRAELASSTNKDVTP